jgi:hypothetical protein
MAGAILPLLTSKPLSTLNQGKACPVSSWSIPQPPEHNATRASWVHISTCKPMLQRYVLVHALPAREQR